MKVVKTLVTGLLASGIVLTGVSAPNGEIDIVYAETSIIPLSPKPPITTYDYYTAEGQAKVYKIVTEKTKIDGKVKITTKLVAFKVDEFGSAFKVSQTTGLPSTVQAYIGKRIEYKKIVAYKDLTDAEIGTTYYLKTKQDGVYETTKDKWNSWFSSDK
ncbi:hypothetical protein ABE042_22335 [Viridibacillus arvi]|uniref:hypothetical protein n=1 Tax=Viridibacillus arvi TaxID=263475 RepID=UPI003D28046D